MLTLDDRHAVPTDPFLKRVAEIERDLESTMPHVATDPHSHRRMAGLIAKQERTAANRTAREKQQAAGIVLRMAR